MPVPNIGDLKAPSDETRFSRLLVSRKGSGGGGKGGGGSSGKGGGSDSGGDGSSSSSGSKSSGKGSKASSPSTAKLDGYSSSASSFKTVYSSSSAYGSGISSRTVIPVGVPFAGRYANGGLRGNVYGGTRYGSGYPYGGRGVFLAGRPFPFAFWPIYYVPHYYDGDEYGPENNSSRPGGAEFTAQIISNGTEFITSDSYHILGDSDSVRAVLDALVFNCSVVNTTLIPYSGSNYSLPQPEQAIQYYRSSSFVLFADNYNNTVALLSNAPTSNDSTISGTDTPLPSSLNATFLECLNATIGSSVPLTNAARGLQPSSVGMIGLLWLFLALYRSLI